jgi:tetraacyldisaccharide 4'-kinase
VISIGNLAAGGRAKTPMAALVASALRDAGERPSILSRGYARRVAEDGVTVVRDADGIRADVDRSGDEPLMLARRLDGVAVLVSSSRFLAGRLAETQFGCTVHVLDDGFQHFDLKRDADIVIVAPADLDRPITLPSGRLREPLDALRAADAVVILDAPSENAGSEDPAYKIDVGQVSRRGEDAADVGRVFRPADSRPADVKPGTPIWRAWRAIDRASSSDPVLAVAGIASPENFVNALRAAGWNVAADASYRDHHRYTSDDVAAIAARARAAGASRVVTTEKDYVRLLPFRPWPLPIEAVPMRIELDDRETFVAWLLSIVRRART